MLAFNSEIEITSETNGNWYIEQLLAKPNVAFRCTQLKWLLAGLAEETSSDLDQLMAETQKKVDIVGTFNAATAGGLGADALSERTASHG